MIAIPVVVTKPSKIEYCPLEVGDNCVIQKIVVTECCREVLVDIGIEPIPYLHKYVMCPCGKTSFHDNIWWFNIGLFTNNNK